MAADPGPALSPELLDALRTGAAEAAAGVVAFCRDLVRIRSPSGDEEAAALRTAEELRGLGIPEVRIDGAGNVLAVLPANHPEPLPGAVMLNAHLDHVDAGDEAAWSHPPFAGVIADGRLWGRGATDTKSAVAAQVHAAGVLRRLADDAGLKRRRDLIVAAVVQEELGGLGTACMLEDAPALSVAIIGEPSLGGLSCGHRGRVEVEVTFTGQAAHASRPDWGRNPHRSLAGFVRSLSQLELQDDALLGSSSVAPTLVHAIPDSPNVIPERLALTLDWRNVPAETPAAILTQIGRLATAAAEEGITTEVRTRCRDLVSWTGRERSIQYVSLPFSTERESWHFRAAHAALSRGLGHEVPVITWDFASDGGWLEAAGVTCIGHGPGEMQVMHALDESVSLALLEESVAGYALLALGLDGEEP